MLAFCAIIWENSKQKAEFFFHKATLFFPPNVKWSSSKILVLNNCLHHETINWSILLNRQHLRSFLRRAVKCKKEFILDLIDWRLHNKHFLSSSGTQIKRPVSSARGRAADCICAQTDLWYCVIRVKGKYCNCLFPPLQLSHEERCDSPCNYCQFKVEVQPQWRCIAYLN